MAEWRVLVTGSRDWRYPATIRRALESAYVQGHAQDGRPPWMTVVHGGARGVDSTAAAYARDRGWNVEVHHADWEEPCDKSCPPDHRRPGRAGDYCPNAGHRRNQQMVDGFAHLVLVFCRNHSGGTEDCLKRARKAGLNVVDPFRDCACHPVGQPVLPI